MTPRTERPIGSPLETSPDAMIGAATTWAEGLWRLSSSRWAGRTGQDHSFRETVIHPAIRHILANLDDGGPLDLIDLGCGDGILLTDDLISSRIAQGGSYLGIDRSSTLINLCRERHRQDYASFLVGDLADPTMADHLVGQGKTGNRIISIFVVQEIPDAGTFFSNLSRILDNAGPNGMAVVVTVHPTFAEWLRDEGRLTIEPSLTPLPDSSIPWRWVGCYPIVDEPGDPFVLPHFQRTTEDYIMLARKAGMTVTTEDLPDPVNDLPRLVKQGVSPFLLFPGNAYWPGIGEAPSALALILGKEPRHG